MTGRRLFALLAPPLLLGTVLFVRAAANKPITYTMYVGTYTGPQSKGIYAFNYDAGTGKLTRLGLAAETASPSFLTVSSDGKFLYAVNEIQDYQKQSSGGVSAFKIDAGGKLEFLNEVASAGADPCYLALDRSGKYVLVANYSGGNVAAFPILSDGSLGKATSVLEDKGALGPNRDRQEKAHAHWIQTSARNRFAYVADLGLDRVLIYKFDASSGKLSDASSSASSEGKDFFSANLQPGTGPRHVAFSADGNFMYVLGELDSSVTVFANDEKERYRQIEKISTLPHEFSGKNDAAELTLGANGSFLYASNRGDDSIAVFSVDKSTGKLTGTEWVAAGGRTPRFFTIDPTGTRMLVANQDSGNIVEFAIDSATGKLRQTGERVSAPSPVSIVFVPRE